MKPKRAFTVIELLVVIAVIGILVALLRPTLSAAKAKAQRTVCVNNLRQINLGIHLYLDDQNNGSPGNPMLHIRRFSVGPIIGNSSTIMWG